MPEILGKRVRTKDLEQYLKKIPNVSADALEQVQHLLPTRRKAPRFGLVELLVVLTIALVIFGAARRQATHASRP